MLGDRAHGGQEHRGGGRGVAQVLEVETVAVGVGRVLDRPPLGELLVEVGELAHAGDGAAAGGDLTAAGLHRLVLDAVVEAAGLVERGLGTAVGLEPLQLLPAAAREVVGQLLHGVGAAGGVGDPGDVGLVDQQRGGVAGDAASESVGDAQRGVEGRHRDRRRAADTAGERRDRAAQHVDPGVVLREHGAPGDRVLDLPGGLGGAGELQHPGPETAGGAELGDREELLVGDGVAELQQPGGLFHGETEVARRIGGAAQERRTGRQRPAQLVGVMARGVVDPGGVDRDAAAVLASELDQACQDVVGPGPGSAGAAGPSAPRVDGPDRARGGGDLTLGEDGREGLGCPDRVLGTVQDDRREVDVHLLEHGGQVADRESAAAEPQPQAGGAVLQVGERVGSGLLRVRVGEVGTDVPALLGPGEHAAARVRRLARPTGRRKPVEVLGETQRQHVDAVEGGAGELGPHEVVGVVVAQAAGLAQDVGGGLLPLRPGGPRVLLAAGEERQVLHGRSLGAARRTDHRL